MEKSCRTRATKASPRPIFNFCKYSLTAIACNKLFLKRCYFEEGLSKSHKKLIFFLLKSIPFNEQNHKKQKGPGTSDQSLTRLQSKFRKIPLLVMHYLI